MNSNSTIRIINVINFLASKSPQTAGLIEVTDVTGYGKTTVWQILNTLCSTGFALQSPIDRKYGLGLKFAFHNPVYSEAGDS